MMDSTTVPAGRVSLGRLAGWVTLITALALFISWLVDLPYVLSLCLWFFFCLGLGHWIFCRSLSVTQRDIRLIDYLYLGAGAVSIVLAAGSYEESRAQYSQMLDDALIPADRPGLNQSVQREEDICGSSVKNFMPESYCQWIGSLKTFLASNPSVADLEQQITDGHRLIDREKWDSWSVYARLLVLASPERGPRRTIPDPNSWSDRGRLMLERQQMAGYAARGIVRSMEKIVQNEKTHPPQGTGMSAKPPEPVGMVPALTGLSRYALWPFLLIFALAIRFIKVTAEVTGWVK